MQGIISSQQTFYYKQIFPKIYFGGIALFSALIVFLAFTAKDAPIPFFVIFVGAPLFLGLLGYFIMRRFIFDLVDEVRDEGDALVVKNGGREERIPLSKIINVADTVSTNPPRITLTLRSTSSFGKEVTFSPPRRRFTRIGTRNPIALELIERIDAARHSHSEE